MRRSGVLRLLLVASVLAVWGPWRAVKPQFALALDAGDFYSEEELGTGAEGGSAEEDLGLYEPPEEAAEAQVDEHGNVVSTGDSTHEDDLYIIDELSQGELRATLILDEITEYYDEDGTTWYKIQLHLLNSGEVPLCGAQIEVSNSAAIEEVWTLEAVEDTNLFDLLWAMNIRPDDARYFGLITHGSEVPDIGLHSVAPCEDTGEEEEEALDDDEEGGDEDLSEPIEDAEEMRAHGHGGKAKVTTTKRSMLLADDMVTLEVDEMAGQVQLVVDEVQEWKDEQGVRQVLVNAHITNVATYPICGISIWIYNFAHALQYWSITAEKFADGKVSETVRLPSHNSELEASQTHYFGFVMELEREYPNLTIVSAHDCQGTAPVAIKSADDA
jgi:hypothetical protein